jgi:hypothetical protein
MSKDPDHRATPRAARYAPIGEADGASNAERDRMLEDAGPIRLHDEPEPAPGMQTWLALTFAANEQISYELDSTGQLLTIHVAVVPVRDLPRAASDDLRDWLHAHLAPLAAHAVISRLQVAAHQAVLFESMSATLRRAQRNELD